MNEAVAFFDKKRKVNLSKINKVMYKINNLKILIVGLTSVLALANFSKNHLKEVKTQYDKPVSGLSPNWHLIKDYDKD